MITEFNNCFIIHRVCFLRNIFGKRSDLPFLHKSDRKKEKSAVSIMHEQNSICSQKQLNNITHEHTIIFRQLFNCRSRGGLSANKKEETFASDDKYLFREFPLSHTISIILQNIVSLFLVTINFISVLCFVVAEGEKLEKEMNDKGPGEACLIKCDVTKEEDIKVSVLCFLETLQSEVIIIYLPTFSEM